MARVQFIQEKVVKDLGNEIAAGVWLEIGSDMVHLRVYRKFLKRDMKKLARQVKVSQPTVSNWELGRSEPTEKHKKGLVKAFGLESTSQIVFFAA